MQDLSLGYPPSSSVSLAPAGSGSRLPTTRATDRQASAQYADTVKETASRWAYQQIKERIIKTGMPPGAIIYEVQLMQELGLGRTPIREALQHLESESLVVVAPRRGMFVTDVALTDFLAVHEIRMELDALYTRLAVERIGPFQLAEMRRLVSKCEACAGERDLPRLLELDRQAHHLLATAAGNEFLFAEFETNYNLSLRVAYLCLRSLRPADLYIAAFAEVLRGIERHDAEMAGEAMRAHLERFHEAIRQLL